MKELQHSANAGVVERRIVVSSRGCSPQFIVRVLIAAWVSLSRSNNIEHQMPLPREIVIEWIQVAKKFCAAGLDYLADNLPSDPQFDVLNPSTYWTSPDQFYVWWKNNVGMILP